jgi:hypothetical protein
MLVYTATFGAAPVHPGARVPAMLALWARETISQIPPNTATAAIRRVG